MSTTEHTARMVAGMIQGMPPLTVLNQASRLFWTAANGSNLETEQYRSYVDAVGGANARIIERLAQTTQAREIVVACQLSALMQSEIDDVKQFVPAPKSFLAAAALVRVQAMINTILDLAPDLETVLDSWYCETIRLAALAH